MALPTLDATFASAADLPRRQMLARWLVEELGSGSIADYYDLPERYLWVKIAVAAGGPNSEAAYISLPKNYAWSDIYNAVSGDIANSVIVLSGAGLSEANGTFVRDGEENGRPKWTNEENSNSISWDAGTLAWNFGVNGDFYWGYSDVAYPWLVQTITKGSGDLPIPTLTVQTPNHTDWSENVALGHIAAAYRGDTGNPANLATYIDWPWRYKIASIIVSL